MRDGKSMVRDKDCDFESNDRRVPGSWAGLWR